MIVLDPGVPAAKQLDPARPQGEPLKEVTLPGCKLPGEAGWTEGLPSCPAPSGPRSPHVELLSSSVEPRLGLLGMSLGTSLSGEASESRARQKRGNFTLG